MKTTLLILFTLFTITLTAQHRETCVDRYGRQVIHLEWPDSLHCIVMGTPRKNAEDRRIIRLTQRGKAYAQLTFVGAKRRWVFRAKYK
ncbi:MAG: hypothetical protein AAGA31_10745 [Bacteroidota bacterium]